MESSHVQVGSSKRRMKTLRIRLKVYNPSTFKNLPMSLFHEICNLVDAQDLQALALVSKAIRSLILSMPYNRPCLFPLIKEPLTELELKLAKTLIIRASYDRYSWVDKVLNHFKNVVVLEICTFNITRREQIRELLKSASLGGVKKLYVDKRVLKRWQSISKSLKLKNPIDVLDLPADYYETRREILLSFQNNASNTIPLSCIPPIQQEWMHSVPDLDKLFNRYQEKAIKLYRQEGKVSNFNQALALNSIYFIAPASYKHYDVRLVDWCRIVQNCIQKYTVLSIGDLELSNIEKCTREFARTAYINFPEIQTLLTHFRNSACNTRVLNMLDNVSKVIRIDQDPESDDEDTFIMQKVDPIINAYLDNSIGNIKYHGSSTELSESLIRKYQQAMASGLATTHIRARKPDRSAQVCLTSRDKHTAYVCEIKTDKTSKNRPDIVKIATMMKDSLNQAIECGAPREEYSMLGLLVEGRLCTVLVLDLPAEGLYRLIELDTFHTPVGIKDLDSLCSIPKPMLNFCDLLKINSELLNHHHTGHIAGDVYRFLRVNCASPRHHYEYYC